MVFVLSSDTEHLKPLEFSKQGDAGVFCYVNEVTSGSHLSLGAGGQGSQLGDQRAGTFSPIPLIRGGERGWRLTSVTNWQ